MSAPRREMDGIEDGAPIATLPAAGGDDHGNEGAPPDAKRRRRGLVAGLALAAAVLAISVGLTLGTSRSKSSDASGAVVSKAEEQFGAYKNGGSGGSKSMKTPKAPSSKTSKSKSSKSKHSGSGDGGVVPAIDATCPEDRPLLDGFVEEIVLAGDGEYIDPPGCPEEPICLEGNQTAWAYASSGDGVPGSGDDPEGTCFRDKEEIGLSKWGWSIGKFTEGGNYTFDVYAGAGKCELSKGTLVGFLTVEYDPVPGATENSTIRVSWEMCGAARMAEVQLWAGDDYLPVARGGPERYTGAPGQFPYRLDGLGNATSCRLCPAPLDAEDGDVIAGVVDFYVAAHATVYGVDGLCPPEGSE